MDGGVAPHPTQFNIPSSSTFEFAMPAAGGFNNYESPAPTHDELREMIAQLQADKEEFRHRLWTKEQELIETNKELASSRSNLSEFISILEDHSGRDKNIPEPVPEPEQEQEQKVMADDPKIEKYEKHIDQLTIQLETAENYVKAAEIDNEEKVKEIEELKTKIVERNKAIKDLGNDLRDEQKEVEQLKDEQKDHLSKIAGLTKENERLAASAKFNEIAKLREDLEKAETDAAGILNKYREEHKKLVDLEKQVTYQGETIIELQSATNPDYEALKVSHAKLFEEFKKLEAEQRNTFDADPAPFEKALNSPVDPRQGSTIADEVGDEFSDHGDNIEPTLGSGHTRTMKPFAQRDLAEELREFLDGGSYSDGEGSEVSEVTEQADEVEEPVSEEEKRARTPEAPAPESDQPERIRDTVEVPVPYRVYLRYTSIDHNPLQCWFQTEVNTYKLARKGGAKVMSALGHLVTKFLDHNHSPPTYYDEVDDSDDSDAASEDGAHQDLPQVTAPQHQSLMSSVFLGPSSSRATEENNQPHNQERRPSTDALATFLSDYKPPHSAPRTPDREAIPFAPSALSTKDTIPSDNSNSISISHRTPLQPTTTTEPPILATLLMMLIHLLIYLLIWTQHHHLALWLAANESTRSTISHLTSSTHTTLLRYLIGEDWAWDFDRAIASTVQAFGLTMQSYPLPG